MELATGIIIVALAVGLYFLGESKGRAQVYTEMEHESLKAAVDYALEKERLSKLPRDELVAEFLRRTRKVPDGGTDTESGGSDSAGSVRG